MNDIDHLMKAIDPVPRAPERGPGARELRAEIMATEPARSRPFRVRTRGFVLTGVATALAAAGAIGIGLPATGPATEYANAAVAIKKAADHFTVTVTDPAADRERFEEAFRAVGLNVTVKIVPVAPGKEGELIGPVVPGGFGWHGSVGVQAVRPCASAFCGKVWLPSDFPGRVVFGIGRKAAAGEAYVRDDLATDSECMTGYPTHGRTVEAVRAEVLRRGAKIGYRLLWSSPGGGWYEQSVPAERIEADWIVAGCRPYSSDTMEVYVKPGPGAGPAPDPRTVATPEWYDD